MNKAYHIIFTLMVFMGSIHAQNMINRTFTNSNTGDIYTIHLDKEDRNSGIIKRVFGSHKAEECAGNKVNITCIKPGTIGLPNIALKSYMGMFELEGERCSVFFEQ